MSNRPDVPFKVWTARNTSLTRLSEDGVALELQQALGGAFADVPVPRG